MAKKTKKPVGAGDLGRTIEALENACTAAREGRWSDVMTQLFICFDEYRKTMAGEPILMGASVGSIKCPSDDECCDDVNECCDGIEKWCKDAKHAMKTKAKTAASEEDEGEGHKVGGFFDLDLATLLPLILQLIALWRKNAAAA